MRSRLRAFVVVAPGLESLALAEMVDVGAVSPAAASRIRPGRGGLSVELTTRQLYLLHRWCRLPTRVLLRLTEARVRRFDELRTLVRSVSWTSYFDSDAAIDLRVASAPSSKLYHEGAITERVLDALGRTESTPGGQRVYVRIAHDQATISIDATGESMHRRGWRSPDSPAHAAPLRATLAAAMLRAAGYDGSMPLIDPMTGSGTLPIEAARAALGLANERPFAFQSWASFEPGTWASAAAARTPGEVAPIFAADRDRGAVEMAATNAAAAGVAEVISFEHAALGAQHWPVAPSLVVCNPPYGHRLGDRAALGDLYAALGKRVSDGGHRLCLLAADPRLAAATGLALGERFATTNGGIAVRCLISP